MTRRNPIKGLEEFFMVELGDERYTSLPLLGSHLQFGHSSA